MYNTTHTHNIAKKYPGITFASVTELPPKSNNGKIGGQSFLLLFHAIELLLKVTKEIGVRIKVLENRKALIF